MTRRFPHAEAEVLELGKTLADGLAANTDLFPAPPAPAEAINESLAECQSALDAVVAAKAALKEAVSVKDGKLEALEVGMKKDFRYAEDAVDKDDAKLARIGWSGRHAPTSLAAPGQVRSLHVTAQGEGWLEMDWKKPADGGRVATYRIQRREAGSGPWTLVEIAMETEARIADQARGSRLEYCVVATNKTGEGEMSNTVAVVL
uniref:Fibronectin type III domain-containing protein n=1 Tax=Candidatus Kentrum sp. SD TaxID=2126332 RepID=A0A450Z966_9GAMM|nr:MAG: Fibronectin type III domain-containing protein [Candidatus Kentron sp. SD]VFK81276.1 MAG: Fibronectin type III domain-containing protein [Candidatus Kentron sp. SD]